MSDAGPASGGRGDDHQISSITAQVSADGPEEIPISSPITQASGARTNQTSVPSASIQGSGSGSYNTPIPSIKIQGPDDGTAENTIPTISSVCSLTLRFPPSALEFSWENPEWFVVGTYNLTDSTPQEQEKADNGKGKGREKLEAESIGHFKNFSELEDAQQAQIGEDVKMEDAPTKGPETKGGGPVRHIVKGGPLDFSEKGQKRKGSLHLYRIFDDSLVVVHERPYPSGVLDLHFAPHHPDLLGIASSTGAISLYSFDDTSEDLPDYNPFRSRIKHFNTFQLFPKTTLILSLAWHTSFPDIMGVTLSTGFVALLGFNNEYTTCEILRQDLNPHNSMEAWCVAFSPAHHLKHTHVSQSIYSGGDDNRLRCVTFNTFAATKSNIDTLRKSSTGGLKGMAGHSSGITAILPIPIDTKAGQDILLTGSYDDHVRVFATYDHRPDQTDKGPKVLAELNLGGGVWRLKFLRDYSLRAYDRVLKGGKYSDAFYPKSEFYRAEGAVGLDTKVEKYRVLASCMYVGARILEIEGSKHGDWTIKVLAKFVEHESMCYACDVQPITRVPHSALEQMNDKQALIVSTSFYDKKLCIWSFTQD